MPDRERTPFLKVENVVEGDEIRFTGFVRRLDGNFGPQIIAEVILQRTQKTYDWGIRVGGDTHRHLFRALGRDETRWRGTVKLTIATGRGDRKWIDIKDAESDEAPFDVPGEPGERG